MILVFSNSELRLALLQHDYWTMLDRQNVLAEVSLADVIHFSQETLPKGCFVEGLVQGNLSPQVSSSVYNTSPALTN